MSAEPDRGRRPGEADEPPPGGRWGVLYALVIGELILILLFLSWLTRAFT